MQGFANFYRWFIRKYSQVAAPHAALISLSHLFLWTPEADKVFGQLKRFFTAAPVLTQPDLTMQFVIKVDA
ncbi:hypothetical protein L3Q82_009157 [Scortum barcoo]|uniref:Uncharacterized protein n=1 Tax=Scortum barcoo TaxID=214431 RepID=A0ACB8XAV2_9TELE|nr:hypothetical protein L3Q82_009157 [Scortum barcoo]